ncbi:PREDICTED: phosphatidylinositol-3-phosphatase myotubularin-1-like [Lupinus angustifolius]|uniref:phosphatidylinositol-3-phosphatase myotubularin-1-like n=1 Tax=Lupinus angustifolius TaxID=3871 RepID=UPI00092F0FF1|nr:PREDICTED: phosphatidylinositol-3-phosphatase myotubularin-1-like [Lupinus angustifolius]
MDLPKHRNARATSLRDATESSKMEGTGSLDSLEWTKIEPISRYVSNANLDFLLEAEQVVAEVRNNTFDSSFLVNFF